MGLIGRGCSAAMSSVEALGGVWSACEGLGGVLWRSYGQVLKSAAVMGQVQVFFADY